MIRNKNIEEIEGEMLQELLKIKPTLNLFEEFQFQPTINECFPLAYQKGKPSYINVTWPRA